jgi:hypothetical protein
LTKKRFILLRPLREILREIDDFIFELIGNLLYMTDGSGLLPKSLELLPSQETSDTTLRQYNLPSNSEEFLSLNGATRISLNSDSSTILSNSAVIPSNEISSTSRLYSNDILPDS